MNMKKMKKLLALSLSLSILTGSSLCVGAAGSGYNGSGYNGSGYTGSSDSSAMQESTQAAVVVSEFNTADSGSASTSSVVKNVIKKADGTTLYSTVAGRYTSKKFGGTVVSSAKANVNAALGVKDGETAWISISDSTCGKKAMQTVNDVSASMGAKVAGILDIYGSKITKLGKRIDVNHPEAEISYTVEIPSGMKAPVGSQIAVLRVYGENGEGKADLLKDMDNDPNTVTFSSDKFGVFAFVYIKNL